MTFFLKGLQPFHIIITSVCFDTQFVNHFVIRRNNGVGFGCLGDLDCFDCLGSFDVLGGFGCLGNFG